MVDGIGVGLRCGIERGALSGSELQVTVVPFVGQQSRSLLSLNCPIRGTGLEVQIIDG